MMQHGLGQNQAASLLDNIVQGQAIMLSTNHIFMLVAVLMVVSAGAIWLAPKPKIGVAPAEVGH
jgi:DHA2 family multidrug resistance protein